MEITKPSAVAGEMTHGGPIIFRPGIGQVVAVDLGPRRGGRLEFEVA